MDSASLRRNVVLLAGGVGGARMALGLSKVVQPGRLSIVVNIGDDDWFHGLKVCPDLDTVLYTLSGLVDVRQGWGVADDATRALDMLKGLGAAQTWMKLGDRDLGLHVHRSHRLREGDSLSVVIAQLAAALGVGPKVMPASDAEVPTRIRTMGGMLRFQEWFVRERARPAVTDLDYHGAASSRASRSVLEAIRQADLVVIAPSNPLLSILPILALPEIREAVRDTSAPCIAVSPLIGGRAVKGPLAVLMADLGYAAGNEGIAHMYRGIIDGMIVDRSDAADAPLLESSFGIDVLTADTWIPEAASAALLAKVVLASGQHASMMR